MSRVGFIGLGRMGGPMVKHLADQDHDVKVFDVVEAAVEAATSAENVLAVPSPREVAEGSEVVFTSLPADSHLRSVGYGEDGILAGLEAGAVWVDHTTASAMVSRELADAADGRGAFFMDAPVSGGVQGAEQGILTVMVGGDAERFSEVKPLIDTYARLVTLMGPVGSGQLTKMANQICVVGLGQALAEGLNFAESAGLDPQRVVEVMLQGSSTSWEMENRSEFMLAGEYDFGFSTDLMRKDIGLCLEEARRLSIPLPVTALTDQFLADVQRMGGSNWDWCSLMERQRLAGDQGRSRD